MSNGYIKLPVTGGGDVHWKAPVAAVINLPASNNTTGDTRMVTSIPAPYMWNGSAWQAAGGSTAPAEYNAGNSGSAITIDWDNGDNQILTLTANCTITFVHPVVGKNYRLVACQDSIGGRSIVWATPAINWGGGTVPTPTSTSRYCDYFQFYYDVTGYIPTANLNHADMRYPFDPLQLSGCVMWASTQDASFLPGAVNGSPQATWNDRSASAYVLSQGTGANQGVYHSSGMGINSKPYLAFNGTTQFYQSTTNFSLSGNAVFTIFVVCDSASAAHNQTPMGWGSSAGTATGAGMYFSSGSVYTMAYSGGASYVTTANQGTGVQVITATKAAGAINTNSAMRVNGVALTGGSSSSNTPNITAGLFSIGEWANYTGDHFQGKISEVIVYNRVLSGAEITQVESYLNTIYGAF
jgi:hypothetical protein